MPASFVTAASWANAMIGVPNGELAIVEMVSANNSNAFNVGPPNGAAAVKMSMTAIDNAPSVSNTCGPAVCM